MSLLLYLHILNPLYALVAYDEEGYPIEEELWEEDEFADDEVDDEDDDSFEDEEEDEWE
jgi:hypothetical protein